jgi:hypothetical protein
VLASCVSHAFRRGGVREYEEKGVTRVRPGHCILGRYLFEALMRVVFFKTMILEWENARSVDGLSIQRFSGISYACKSI